LDFLFLSFSFSLSYSGKCFEPPSFYKGDFARSYFYISVAYMKEWDCCETSGTNLASINSWMEDILREWHTSDPVDDSERNRNNDIYTQWQQNRNPFIDYPELVSQINDF
jgi:endonuclease I